MRDELVRVLSIRPAHFASNLGVVELCLAWLRAIACDVTKESIGTPVGAAAAVSSKITIPA